MKCMSRSDFSKEETMSGPGLAEISSFVAIAEQRSFAKAALRLGLAVSTLSQNLRRLEDRLGVRLIERSARSVAATEAGERLLARLRPLLDDYEEAFEAVSEFRNKTAGRLRITVGSVSAHTIMASVLARFLAEHPGIKLEISVDDAFDDIVASRFDAGLRIGERLERDMIAVRVSNPQQRVVVGSPAYLDRQGTPKTPDDLAGHNCIQMRFARGDLHKWDFGRGRKSLKTVVQGNFTANDWALALRAAQDGLGLLQVARDYAQQSLTAGKLVTVLDDWQPPPFDGFFLYYPSRRHIRGPLRALVDFLRKASKVNARSRHQPP
jgi:DNA-binding transcriptional LysR family regulator